MGRKESNQANKKHIEQNFERKIVIIFLSLSFKHKFWVLKGTVWVKWFSIFFIW